MSDALYCTRLRWHNGSGVAMLHGRKILLTQAPEICGNPVDYIDYTPEVRCLEIRYRACDTMQEMTHKEIICADSVLRALLGV